VRVFTLHRAVTSLCERKYSVWFVVQPSYSAGPFFWGEGGGGYIICQSFLEHMHFEFHCDWGLWQMEVIPVM